MSQNDIRKKHIMETAAKLFLRYGYRRTSIDDIVREVGIAKGSLYLHFPTKENLFREIIADNHQQIHQRTADAVKRGKDPVEKIELLVFQSLEGFEMFPMLAKYMDQESDLNLPPELNLCEKEACEMRQFMADDFFAEIIVNGVKDGLFRPDINVQATVAIIISFFHIYIYNRRYQFIEDNVNDFMKHMLDILFNGILICDPNKSGKQSDSKNN
jgi:AcrR family transcriptional regulator